MPLDLNFRTCALAGVVAIGALLSTTANASIVRFQATFTLFKILDGLTNVCPLDSACAGAFEADTGLAPNPRNQPGPRWEITGDLRFDFDANTGNIVPGGVLTLSNSASTVLVKSGASIDALLSGGPLGCVQGGLLVRFAVSATGFGSATFCNPTGTPGVPSTLYDVMSSPTGFGGSVSITPTRGQGWGLSTDGRVLAQVARIPEPATLALVSVALLGVVATKRRKHKYP